MQRDRTSAPPPRALVVGCSAFIITAAMCLAAATGALIVALAR